MREVSKADAAMGRRLAMLMQDAGKTVNDIAVVLGVTSVQARNYLSGDTRLKATDIPPLAHLLGVSPETFFDSVAAKPKTPTQKAILEIVSKLPRSGQETALKMVRVLQGG